MLPATESILTENRIDITGYFRKSLINYLHNQELKQHYREIIHAVTASTEKINAEAIIIPKKL